MGEALRSALADLAAPPDVQVAGFGGDGLAPVALMRRFEAAWWAESGSVSPSARQDFDELLWLVTLDREYRHEPATREFWCNGALSSARWAEIRDRARELLRGGDADA